MSFSRERKVILVTRQTRLEELVQRYHTLAQAQFYIEHLGADFSDYLRENAAYAISLRVVVEALQQWGRYQIIERHMLPNFCFGADDIVVALGQDGLVANTLKYLQEQPLIGINPETSRWDGLLLPFQAKDLAALLPEVSKNKHKAKTVSMAQATLSDGQVMRAVNDLFIGPINHTSALYEIEVGKQHEAQSSSGIIVATGLGSTAWIKSIVTGSMAIAQAIGVNHKNITKNNSLWHYEPQPWDSNQLTFAVREPFPSRHSQAHLVFGHVTREVPLILHSRMAENGVIFSDGMSNDYLSFNAGMTVNISLAPVKGQLVI